MRDLWRAALAAALFGSTGCAAAQATPDGALEPIGKWTIDYQNELCVLQRRYGDGQSAVSFGLRPYPLSEQIEIVLVRPSGPGEPYRHGNGALVVDGREVKATYQSYYLADMKVRAVTFYADLGLDAVMNADVITLSGDADRPVTLAPRGSAAAKTATLKCQDDLLATWKVDVAAIHALRRGAEAIAPSAALFRADDYPAAAIRANEGGHTVVVLTVSPTGRVESCDPVMRASPHLDEATCHILSNRARYRPAIGLDGAPATGWAVVSVRWVIPH